MVALSSHFSWGNQDGILQQGPPWDLCDWSTQEASAKTHQALAEPDECDELMDRSSLAICFA